MRLNKINSKRIVHKKIQYREKNPIISGRNKVIEKKNDLKVKPENKTKPVEKSEPVKKELVKPINVELIKTQKDNDVEDRMKRRLGNKVELLNANIRHSKNIIKPISIEQREPISIIIPAYQTQDYIEECLDSIENQTYFKDFNDYEVLVGVDGCEKTLNKLLEIRHKYRNLRIFMMESNKGTYITINTLVTIIKTKNIIIFGADDIMLPNMIGEIMINSSNNKIIQFGFNKHKNNKIIVSKSVACGAIFLKSNIVDKLGGFRDWVCAADREFIVRASTLFEIKKINKPLFIYRIHKNSVTQKKETNAYSHIRKKYHEKINKTFEHITPVINNFIEYKKKIILCIPFYKRYEITEFVFDYYFKLKKELSNIIDIDIITSGSEGNKSKSLSNKYNFTYIEEKNTPLSQKQNSIYLTAKNYNPDACMKLDSDSIISKEYFLKINDLLLTGYDYISIEDIYFAFNDGIGYWSGYKNHRKGEGVGTGRVMSKKILEDLNWKPWGDIKINSGLDKYLTKKINNSYKSILLSSKENDFVCVDLKSNIGISNMDDFIFENWLSYNNQFSFITNNLRRNLKKINNKSMIPKIIHQIWIGPKPAPKFMHTWADNHPDYEYILWDEERIKKELFPLENQHLYDLYDNETQNVWNGKSNLLRIEILKKYGGVYVDADCISLRKLDDFLLENEVFVEYANEMARPGIIAWGVIGSIPNHKLFIDMISSLKNKKKIIQPSHIFSGPTFLTKTINNKKYNVKIYPSYYFLPKFYKNNRDYDYRGDFKPYCDHVWGTTKNIYGKI